MATQVQIRRGSTSQHNVFTGAIGEITVDTDKDTLVVHDGSTQGGIPLAKESALGNLAALDSVDASKIDANAVGASELNVSGNGTTAQYLRSDGDGTFTWATPTDTNTTYSAGTGLDLTSTTFSIESDLRDGITHIGRDANDYIGINTTTHSFYLDGGERARMVNNGDFHADGDVIAYSTTISDERLKEDIEVVEDAAEKLKNIRGVTFTRKDSGDKSAGVIAQEVEKILPEAVKEKTLPLQTGDEDTKYKVVEYDALHAILIEAVKNLVTRVEELEKR